MLRSARFAPAPIPHSEVYLCRVVEPPPLGVAVHPAPPARRDGEEGSVPWWFHTYAPALGICQWFHFEDHRLEAAVRWLRELGVRQLRTGLSWADSYRDGWQAWFDRQMTALEEFEVTVTFCFTPEQRGVRPHHTSPPLHAEEYAEFCARMVRRYA